MATSYLEKRNNIFYFVRHIPKKYQSIFQKKRIKCSLKTSDKKLAKIKASLLNVDFITLIYGIDSSMIFREKNGLKRFDEGKNNMMQLILKDINYEKRTIGHVEFDSDNFERDYDAYEKIQSKVIQIPESVATTATTKSEPSVTVQKLVDDFSDEKISTGVWPEKRRNEIGAIFNLFTDIYGKEILAESVNKGIASEFKKKLLKLPPNINGIANANRYGGKTLDEIIALGDSAMSTTNINKYIGNLSSLFQWGEDHGHLTKNPFKRLKIKGNGKKKINEERSCFSDDDLINIHQEIYSRKSLKAFMYWLPIMGLLHGSRLRELSQLYLSDVYQINSIWVFDVNEKTPDKSVKNAHSIRIVPIHSKLIELGLLEYIENLKKRGEERLFPEITYRREGYATTPSKWFNKIREKLGMTGLTPMKDFHSYRHTFSDHLKQKGYPEGQVSAITGHGGGGGITFNRYANDYNTELLASLINDIDFDHVMKGIPKFADVKIRWKLESDPV